MMTYFIQTRFFSFNIDSITMDCTPFSPFSPSTIHFSFSKYYSDGLCLLSNKLPETPSGIHREDKRWKHKKKGLKFDSWNRLFFPSFFNETNICDYPVPLLSIQYK